MDFNFPEKTTGFSKTIELCLNFCMVFCIPELVLANYKKHQSIKHNFILTRGTTLISETSLEIKSKSKYDVQVFKQSSKYN